MACRTIFNNSSIHDLNMSFSELYELLKLINKILTGGVAGLLVSADLYLLIAKKGGDNSIKARKLRLHR